MVFLLPFQKLQLNFRLKGATATLIVNSLPNQAEVFLNDKFLGKTPMEGFSVEAEKELKISCYKDGFLKREEKILLQEGEQKVVSCQLIPHNLLFIRDGFLYLASFDGSNLSKISEETVFGKHAFFFGDQEHILFLKKEIKREKLPAEEQEIVSEVGLPAIFDIKTKRLSVLLEKPTASIVPSVSHQLAAIIEAKREVGSSDYRPSGRVYLLELPNLPRLSFLYEIDQPVEEILFSGDDKYLAVITANKLVILDVASRQKIFESTFPKMPFLDKKIPYFAWSKDSQFLFYAPVFIALFASDEEKKQFAKSFPDGMIHFLSFSLAEKRLKTLFSTKTSFSPLSYFSLLSFDSQKLLYKSARRDKAQTAASELKIEDFNFYLKDLNNNSEIVVLPEIEPEAFILDSLVLPDRAYLLVTTKTKTAVYELSWKTGASRKVAEMLLPAKKARFYLSGKENLYVALLQPEDNLGTSVNFYKVENVFQLKIGGLSDFPDSL
jgi:WD40 repeat protein